MLPLLPSYDHYPTSFEYMFAKHCVHILLQMPHCRAWHRGTYCSISKRLSDIDWDLKLSYLNVNDTDSILVSVLTGPVEKFVPLQPAGHGPPWPSQPPASLTCQCQNVWNAFEELSCRFIRTTDAAATAPDTCLSGSQ